MASWIPRNSTSPSCSNPEFKARYDIFLSFRCSDTRIKFTGHLYHNLKREGFKTFRDDNEINRGEVIKSELLEAIRNSRMSVIVLSENYANSTACLLELHAILELCKKSTHFVLPVFYEVEPEVLKQQSEKLDFGEKEVAAEKVKGWSAALKEVASMAGMVFRKGSERCEADFIEEIIGVLKGKLARKHRSVDNHLVGMDMRTERINSWLKDQSSGVGPFFICGMGGIGKTTIAKVVYNSNLHIFDATSFLENVSGVSKGHTNGLVDLQRHLLRDILGKNECINNVDDGRDQIKYALNNKRVLLVLDDVIVDQQDQLFALAGQSDWFFPGSKIIITTRIGRMRQHAYGVYDVYSPATLSLDESLELFSWHAFGQKHPIESHMALSQRFVQYCDGHPLALQVVGSSCCVEKKIDVWKSDLDRLEANSDKTILKKLEMSYDSLKHNEDKHLFLDIACFFIGKKKREAITILESCGYPAASGIYNLEERNLLTRGPDTLEMHQLLQEMGKQIADESKYPEERSRVWRSKESFDILFEKIGTSKIEGLVLDMNVLKNSEKVVFEANTFEKMYNLRLLKLTGVRLSGSHNACPKRLRWLYWHGFPSESFPSDFPMENLVSLDMQYSNLKSVEMGTKVLPSLKILNLSHSLALAKTPDFSRIPNLEKLVLKACTSLSEVDESIVGLQKIKSLNLEDCKNLRKLPRNICMVASLSEIDVSGCSELMGAIEELEKMKSLQVLKASRTDINRLFSTLWVPKPVGQTFLASLPCSLVKLNISNCNLTENSFPRDLKLHNLQNLVLSANPISSLPNCIKDLKSLEILDVSDCRQLRQILWRSTILVYLRVGNSDALEEILFEPGTFVRAVFVMNCPNLNHIQNLLKFVCVKEVDVELLNRIGFFDLHSMADTEATILNRVTVTSPPWALMKLPIQIVNDEGNVFYTFYPGREVPVWFSNKNNGSTISFTATLSSHFCFGGLNLCAVYTLPDGAVNHLPDFQFEIDNKSRGVKIIRTIHFTGIPEKGGDMVWLGHCFQGNLFTEGDELEVSFKIKRLLDVMTEQYGECGQIKECGVHLLYFENEEEVFQYGSTIQHSWDPNLSPCKPEEDIWGTKSTTAVRTEVDYTNDECWVFTFPGRCRIWKDRVFVMNHGF